MSIPGFTAEIAIYKPSATSYGRRSVWRDSRFGAITMASSCPSGQTLQCTQVPTTVTNCSCVANSGSCAPGKPWCGCLQSCATPGLCYECEKTRND
jgi:hypothetical protein